MARETSNQTGDPRVGTTITRQRSGAAAKKIPASEVQTLSLALAVISHRTLSIIRDCHDPEGRAFSNRYNSGFEPKHALRVALCGIAAEGLSEEMALSLILYGSGRQFRRQVIPSRSAGTLADRVEYIADMYDGARAYVANNPAVNNSTDALEKLGLIRSQLTLVDYGRAKHDEDILATLVQLGQEAGRVEITISVGELALLTGVTAPTVRAASRRLEAKGLLLRHGGKGGMEASRFELFCPPARELVRDSSTRAAQGQLVRSTPGDGLVTEDAFKTSTSARTEKQLGGSGLQIFRCLRANPGAVLQVGQIAELENLHVSTVRSKLSRLESSGLVRRVSVKERDRGRGRPPIGWAAMSGSGADPSLRKAAEEIGTDGLQVRRVRAFEEKKAARELSRQMWGDAAAQVREWLEQLGEDGTDVGWIERRETRLQSIRILHGVYLEGREVTREEWLAEVSDFAEELDQVHEELLAKVAAWTDGTGTVRWGDVVGQASKLLRKGLSRKQVVRLLAKRVAGRAKTPRVPRQSEG